jgi:hypothetical protein
MGDADYVFCDDPMWLRVDEGLYPWVSLVFVSGVRQSYRNAIALVSVRISLNCLAENIYHSVVRMKDQR